MLRNLKVYKIPFKLIGYWFFLIGGGLLLAYIEEIDNIEPIFSISAFFYWILLIYWSSLWLFKQIKSVLIQKKQKNHIELLHLQSQVNPHFFFNMLNNLYGLVDKDSGKAKKLILQLSDLMRYSIYEGEKEAVTLEEEIAYLKNYIELHKLRYHKKIDFNFNVEIDQKEYKILPLLFIILLENAFKHGVEKLTENAFVNINLSVKQNVLIFKIENNFDDEINDHKKGIGLINLKRRLKLKYPQRHHFTINMNNALCIAELTIYL